MSIAVPYGMRRIKRLLFAVLYSPEAGEGNYGQTGTGESSGGMFQP